MARLNVLEYKADFIRGWPHGEAVEMNYPSDTAFGNGDLVEIAANGKFVEASVGSVAPAVIARGQNDTFESGGTGRNNLYTQVVPNIGILSNFVIRTSNVIASGTTPHGDGAPLAVGGQCGVGSTAAGGADRVWANSSAANVTAVGTVLEIETGIIDADGNSLPDVAVILVK